MLLIGLMSGTSADGICAALVDVFGTGRRTRCRLVAWDIFPYTGATRAAILNLCRPGHGTTADVCALHATLGELFSQAAQAVANQAAVPIQRVEAICCHGQTVWHQPASRPVARRRNVKGTPQEGSEARCTLQIGDAAIIAYRTGRPVLSNFRAADMAAGGQGAPLVPFVDWALHTSRKEARALLNLGGIANVTHLPRDARLDQVTAFDTGPGNMVLDEAVRLLSGGAMEFDAGGAWAVQGSVHGAWLHRLLAHPYFRKPPPKSTGREEFGAQYAHRVVSWARKQAIPHADILATLTALTAQSVAIAFERWLAPMGGVERVWVSGGGVRNATLMRMLERCLAPARVQDYSATGTPAEAKEAVAFAVLGAHTLRGLPANVPAATGAREAVILGSVTIARPEGERRAMLLRRSRVERK
ncbi:MAG: anhydro-N-acetylmuramic acid kinase [Chthonomonadales bacterium]